MKKYHSWVSMVIFYCTCSVRLFLYAMFTMSRNLFYKYIAGQHGLGGRIGMMVAMLYPEILDKLIVVDSTPLMNEKSQQR